MIVAIYGHGIFVTTIEFDHQSIEVYDTIKVDK